MKNVEDIYTLSSMQQGMLFHALYAPKQGVYFEQISCTLHRINFLGFKQAWQQVVARHAVLRTSFIWDGLDEPLQVVHKQVNLPWVESDWQHLSLTQQQKQLEAFLEADRQKGLELNQAPLMRFALMQIEPTSYYFIWSHHHLLLDGWSSSIIFKEVFAFYESITEGKDLYLETPRPYRDYIAYLQQQDLSQAKVFWQQALKHFTMPTPLMVDKHEGKRSHQQTYKEQYLCFRATTTTALKSFAIQHHLTLNTLVQGAWALLLSRYCGQQDVVFGATVSGRLPTLVGAESMVGLFINTLPVRVQISAEDRLLPWLHQLQVQQVEWQQYSYTPLVEIHRWSDIQRGMPLFESIVVFENYPVDTSLQQRNTSIEISNIRGFERTNYPLTVIVAPGSELSVRFSYDADRFDSDMISRMLGHFQTLLTGIVANPQASIWELPLLSAAEQRQLIFEWNDTKGEETSLCIHQLFETQVEKTPDSVAVSFFESQLTYQQLNDRSN
ncbi:MAG: non-ribosomal peptide synthetase, partial [Cyanomargarita calcarea GSE-NOS-MK-12-04C]|nr:non-ribosomal peptide synthetase [Cyanomargarita calcarea GSE-NOS-MK-12-04C]